MKAKKARSRKKVQWTFTSMPENRPILKEPPISGLSNSPWPSDLPEPSNGAWRERGKEHRTRSRGMWTVSSAVSRGDLLRECHLALHNSTACPGGAGGLDVGKPDDDAASRR